jgi:hypothetical protein
VVLDPADSGRELRPGEVFFESPLVCVNTTATTRWIELRILLQGNSGQAIPVTPRVPVPASEAIYLPIQGLRILKADLTNTQPGGRLQVQAEVSDAIKVFGSAVELEALTHAPDSEAS